MSKTRRFSQLILTLLVLLFFWGLFMLGRTLLQEFETHNDEYIPENSNIVIRVDGRRLAESGLEDVVFEQQNDELVRTIRDLLKERDDIGVAFTTNSYVFQLEIEKNVVVWGALVNLRDEEKFDQYLPQYLDKKQGAARKEDVGLIIFSCTGESSKPIDQLAENLLKSPSKFETKKIFREEDKMIEFWMKDGPSKGEIIAHLDFEDQRMLIHGETSRLMKKATSYQALPPDGFHLDLGFIPEALSAQIQSLEKDHGIELPKIERISVNHRKTVVAAFMNRIIAPDLDVLITFKEPIERDSLLTRLAVHERVQLAENGSFQFNEEMYYCHSIDDRTLTISTRQKKFTPKEQVALLKSEGALSPLTNVESSRLVQRVLDISAAYRATKRFCDDADQINFEMTQDKKGEVTLSGELSFKEDVHPVDALIRLFLKGDFFL